MEQKSSMSEDMIEKWRAPVMQADPSRVMRHREQDGAAIPTAEDIEHQLTQLAVTLAQQLVRRELKVEPGEIIGLIRDSVKLLPGNTRNITIMLHPEDARLVRQALSLDGGDEETSWKLVEDPMITRGGCEIGAPPSSINATLENRLSELAASVLGGEREQD